MNKALRVLSASAIALSASLLTTFASPLSVTAAPATDLIISEYLEDGGKKALELYNGSGGAIDLDAGEYEILRYANGGSSPTSIDLTGVIADGGTFVIANDSTTGTLVGADATSGTISHNGDDGYELVKGAGQATVDSFGQFEVDPGSSWPGGTEDVVLRRNADVCAGDTDFSDAFDASAEWTAAASKTDYSDFGSHTQSCAPLEPVINEFSANTITQSGGGDLEIIEIFGPPSSDLSDLTVIEVEGDITSANFGNVIASWPVGTTDANGFFLIESTGLQNGTMTLALVENYDVADTDATDGIAGVIDAVGVNDESDAGDMTFLGATELTADMDADSVSTFPPGGASRIPNGTDTDSVSDWLRNDFNLAESDGDPAGTPVYGEAYNTPGAENEAVPAPVFTPCSEPTITLISAVQGSGFTSPEEGNTVTVQGIVVGDFQIEAAGEHGDISGFFLQEEDADADADPTTSEGIFIYDPGTVLDVSTGDQVAVTGSVSEFGDATQITVTDSEICTPAGSVVDVATPATPVLPVPEGIGYDEYMEQFEGMGVVYSQALTISEFFNYDRFGEVVLSSERLFQPTATYAPGTVDAAAMAAANARDRITLDDGSTEQNPFPIRHPDGSVFATDNSFRGGDTLTGVTGVMYEAFGLYRVHPTASATHTVENPRPTTAPDVGGHITVMGANVLNYFSDIDDGTDDCGPNDDQECRGADDETERQRQLDKIVNAIAEAEPTVVGMMELGNPSTTTAADADPELGDIVDALNAELGAGTYDYVQTGSIGTDAIRQGIIYQPAVVETVGPTEILDSADFVAPNTSDAKNRPAVNQLFREIETGDEFVVSVNHLKSKGSSCDGTATITPDDDPEAGSCNLTRTLAAEKLVDWLGDTYPTEPDVIILGDLNAYDHEDPIVALENAGYVDVEKEFQGENGYSYVFDGQLGYLDYGMVSASLLPEVVEATAWHINADEPDILDYDSSYNDASLYVDDEFRNSDHDPVIIGISQTPTVTVEQGAGQADPVEPGDDIVFDITFSEDVAGLTAGDFVIDSGGVGYSTILTGSGDEYTLEISSLTGEGTITVSLPADVAADTTGNLNSASTSVDNSVTVEIADTTPPTVTVEQGAGQADPVEPGDDIVFDVTFSEDVSGLLISDFDIAAEGIGYTVNLSGGGESYTLVFSGTSADGTITVSLPAGAATDGAGNPSLASTSVDNTVTIDTPDTTAPTVTVEQGAAQVDPVEPGTSVTFDVIFSEDVTGLTISDFDIAADGIGYTVNLTGGGSTHNLVFTNTTGEGIITVSLPAGAATDSGGNATLASTSVDNSVTIESEATTDDELDEATKFVPTTPFRLFDTREAELPVSGPKGILPAGGSVDVPVAGATVGDFGVPADAVAVVMNVTAVNTAGPGHFSVFPTGYADGLDTSVINVTAANQVRPSLVTVPVGTDGEVTFFSHAGGDLVVDIAGWYIDTDEAVSDGRFIPLDPQRVLDTREGEPASPDQKGMVASEASVEVQITGFGGVPATGVSAVVINLTGTQAAANGHLTAYPTGGDTPLASNVNLTTGSTSANLAIVPVNDDGKISVESFGGAHVVIDITGYITDGTTTAATTGLFVPLQPERLFDSRGAFPGPGPKGFIAADTSVDVAINGVGGVPADASGVALNVAGINGPVGHLTMWATGEAMPLASTLNLDLVPTDTRANMAMLPVGADGMISLYSLSGMDAIIDTAGYFM